MMGSAELRLQTLAQHFRPEESVKPPPPPTGSASSDSTTKRAAVLVCLFKGDDGELRVILTKRSSSLSSSPAFSPAPNAAEVEAIFDAPLEMFLKDEKRREEEREWMGDKYLLHYFDFEADDGKEYVIWALTAALLISAASAVYERPPAFLERRPKFWTSGQGAPPCPRF
ncbi:hypothetical protein C1H46_026282 [Malus baccata]|uniref:Nudix hydrolase domain-containing protein n=1 Tax=Malus baccata TaxID=106549 RepID=A0A540LP03_MALBA|nr:hypothetical protein C1H46_026282 [Malus baccata]